MMTFIDLKSFQPFQETLPRIPDFIPTVYGPVSQFHRVIHMAGLFTHDAAPILIECIGSLTEIDDSTPLDAFHAAGLGAGAFRYLWANSINVGQFVEGCACYWTLNLLSVIINLTP